MQHMQFGGGGLFGIAVSGYLSAIVFISFAAPYLNDRAYGIFQAVEQRGFRVVFAG
jgi:hypothetical protein